MSEAVQRLPDMQGILDKLSDFDRDVLRTACGDNRITGWGAAVGETCEYLQSLGLLHPGAIGRPTALGRSVARNLQKAKAKDE